MGYRQYTHSILYRKIKKNLLNYENYKLLKIRLFNIKTNTEKKIFVIQIQNLSLITLVNKIAFKTYFD